jgi:hypothetical protein
MIHCCFKCGKTFWRRRSLEDHYDAHTTAYAQMKWAEMQAELDRLAELPIPLIPWGGCYERQEG